MKYYLFHVHNDIEEAAKWYKIPIVMYSKEDVYIMQEDRCVFVGNPKIAEHWMKIKEGKKNGEYGVYYIEPCKYYKHKKGIIGKCKLFKCEVVDQVKSCGLRE